MTLKPKETGSFSLETVIPNRFIPKSLYVYADSENVSFITELPCWPPIHFGYSGDIVDKNGNAIVEPTIGQELFFPVGLANNNDKPEKYTYFLQVKDERGITVHLSWLTGTIETDGIITLAQSWIPENAGTYNVEILLWSDIESPTPIPPIHITAVTVK